MYASYSGDYSHLLAFGLHIYEFTTAERLTLSNLVGGSNKPKVGHVSIL